MRLPRARRTGRSGSVAASGLSPAKALAVAEALDESKARSATKRGGCAAAARRAGEDRGAAEVGAGRPGLPWDPGIPVVQVPAWPRRARPRELVGKRSSLSRGVMTLVVTTPREMT